MISLDRLKSIAKQKAKKESLSITHAQNEVAKTHGYDNWQKLTYGFSIKIAHLCKVNDWYRVEIRRYDRITLKGLQEMIGDYIELVPYQLKNWIFTTSIEPLNSPKTDKHYFIKDLPEKISMYVDENGGYKDHTPSIYPLLGPIVFLGHEKDNPDEELGLSDQSIEKIKTFMQMLWNYNKDEYDNDEQWGWFDKTK